MPTHSQVIESLIQERDCARSLAAECFDLLVDMGVDSAWKQFPARIQKRRYELTARLAEQGWITETSPVDGG